MILLPCTRGPSTSRHHRPWRMNRMVPLVFSKHVRLNVKASFLSRLSTATQISVRGGLKDSQDTRYSHPIELNLTCNARSDSSINARRFCNVTCHLDWLGPKCGSPEPGGREEEGRCSRVEFGWGDPVRRGGSALLLASLCMCFQLQTKERRSCAACGSI